MSSLTPFQEAIKRLSDGDVDAARQALVAIWEGGGGELRCATLNGLVRRLTHHSIREAHFLDAFLLTYRSFTTPLELLALLKSRFAVPMPHGLVPAERLRYQDSRGTLPASACHRLQYL